MLRTNMIHNYEHLSQEQAEQLVDLWNAAYPLMRDIASGEVKGLRKYIAEEGWMAWEKRQAGSSIDLATLTELGATRENCEKRLKRAERLRLTLGQLDRGTYKGCTRSPGAFSVSGAYSGVRRFLKSTSSSTEGLAPVYRLAVALSEANDRQAERMRNRNS